MKNRKKNHHSMRWSFAILLWVAVALLAGQFILLTFLDHLQLPTRWELLLASTLLLILALLILDLLVLRPMRQEIAKDAASKSELESSHNMLLKVLDGLDALVYVADMQTHELLFLNKFARNIFGDATGEICWQALQSDQTGPCDFCSNKMLLTEAGEPTGMYAWEFKNTINNRWYDIRDRAIRWIDGRLVRLEVATDITLKKTLDEEREELIKKLENALDEVKTLRGIIPICSYCKQIRDDKGYWNQVDVYLMKHSAADFSHSICPDCVRKYHPEISEIPDATT